MASKKDSVSEKVFQAFMKRHGNKRSATLHNLNEWISERLGDGVPSSAVQGIMAARGLYPTQGGDGAWSYAKKTSVENSAA